MPNQASLATRGIHERLNPIISHMCQNPSCRWHVWGIIFSRGNSSPGIITSANGPGSPKEITKKGLVLVLAQPILHLKDLAANLRGKPSRQRNECQRIKADAFKTLLHAKCRLSCRPRANGLSPKAESQGSLGHGTWPSSDLEQKDI